VREGDVQRTGIVLATPGAPVPFLSSLCARAKPIDNELEARLVALEPLPEKRPNRQFAVTLTGDLETYAWSMLDRTWNAHVPLWSHLHQRIELDLVNRTEVAHPMHLHGHMFHVMAVNGQKVRGAMRDTVHVTPGGSVRIAFDADNPGAWLLHCHNLYHMMAGMMTEVVYIGDGPDTPQIARGDDYRQPAGPAPEAGDFLLRDGDR
jgi:FtsP/CotA-like multicopper oxidase with cupredoxin domain